MVCFLSARVVYFYSALDTFHRPLEISQKTRDSHISTARLRGHGKVENQRQVSHFPTAARDDDFCSLSKNQKPKKGSRPLRGLRIPCTFSLRSNGTDFMLILRLENAQGCDRSADSAAGMARGGASRSVSQAAILARMR